MVSRCGGEVDGTAAYLRRSREGLNNPGQHAVRLVKSDRVSGFAIFCQAVAGPEMRRGVGFMPTGTGARCYGTIPANLFRNCRASPCGPWLVQGQSRMETTYAPSRPWFATDARHVENEANRLSRTKLSYCSERNLFPAPFHQNRRHQLLSHAIPTSVRVSSDYVLVSNRLEMM